MGEAAEKIDEPFLVLTLLCNFPTRLAPDPTSDQLPARAQEGW